MTPDLKVAIVCGGRDLVGTENRNRIHRALDQYHDDVGICALVQGGAPGVDRYAKDWALLNGVPMIEVPAQWGRFGKPAGPLRNGWMLEFVRVDVVLAFPGGDGTADMVARAEEAGIPVRRLQ